MTMLMNAVYVGFVDLPLQSNPLLMLGQPSVSIGALATCLGSNQYAAFPADANGTFVPVSGYGGTSNPSVSGSGVGLTMLSQVQTQFVPSFTFAGRRRRYGHCGGAMIQHTAIWNDIVTNTATYNSARYGGNDFGGQYQGIWDLEYAIGFPGALDVHPRPPAVQVDI